MSVWVLEFVWARISDLLKMRARVGYPGRFRFVVSFLWARSLRGWVRRIPDLGSQVGVEFGFVVENLDGSLFGLRLRTVLV